VSLASARETLKRLRKEQGREPEKVRECADVVLKSRGSLGDEVWVILEQDTNAALDMHDFDRAERNIKDIEYRFGDEGNRVGILRGSFAEAKEEWAEAEKIYKAIKEKDESLPAPRKRLVALNKARNRMDAAAFELVEYLDIWMTDHEAWLELTDIYLNGMRYKHAAYCLEELIILQPYNYAHHLRFAELLYTLGGLDRVEVARKHFQQAEELKPGCARALYGLLLCVSQLGGGKKPREDPEHMGRLFGYMQGKLEVAYAKSNDKGALMTESLNALRTSTL